MRLLSHLLCLLISLAWPSAWNLYHRSPLTGPLGWNLGLWFPSHHCVCRTKQWGEQREENAMWIYNKLRDHRSSGQRGSPPSEIQAPACCLHLHHRWGIACAGQERIEKHKAKAKAQYFLPFCLTHRSPLSSAQIWKRRLFWNFFCPYLMHTSECQLAFESKLGNIEERKNNTAGLVAFGILVSFPNLHASPSFSASSAHIHTAKVYSCI